MLDYLIFIDEIGKSLFGDSFEQVSRLLALLGAEIIMLVFLPDEAYLHLIQRLSDLPFAHGRLLFIQSELEMVEQGISHVAQADVPGNPLISPVEHGAGLQVRLEGSE